MDYRGRCRNHINRGTCCSLALIMAILCGCANVHCCFSYERRSDSGTKFYILGLGLVEQPATHGNDEILVAQYKALGVTISSLPGFQATAGYINSSFVSVPTNANSITEVKSCPINEKTLKIEVLKRN